MTTQTGCMPLCLEGERGYTRENGRGEVVGVGGGGWLVERDDELDVGEANGRPPL